MDYPSPTFERYVTVECSLRSLTGVLNMSLLNPLSRISKTDKLLLKFTISDRNNDQFFTNSLKEVFLTRFKHGDNTGDKHGDNKFKTGMFIFNIILRNIS